MHSFAHRRTGELMKAAECPLDATESEVKGQSCVGSPQTQTHPGAQLENSHFLTCIQQMSFSQFSTSLFKKSS